MPYAKLQATVIALPIGLFVIYAALHRQRMARGFLILAILAASVAPTVPILVPLLAAGEVGTFWQSYIVWSIDYTKTSDQSSYVDNIRELVRLVSSIPQIKFVFFGALFLCGVSIFSVILRRPDFRAAKSY